ncbi:hypothetical protein RJT34_16928 [Clitoria ternatea]|uniref:BHLH domain-containing protein n=1 Tax=Clitoria ternatea TaxID=43366 RepID=A0AAN9J801_CLITE
MLYSERGKRNDFWGSRDTPREETDMSRASLTGTENGDSATNTAFSCLSFEEFNDDDVGAEVELGYLKSVDEELGSCYCSKRSNELEEIIRGNGGKKRARTSSETLCHIMSERKRRQEISQKFIALSATIPGLKKIDKASILEEAINYMRQLQRRIAELEEESNNKKNIKSLIISKSNYGGNEVLHEVEARGLGKEVLIRIHCEKRKDIMHKLLTLLKDVHLSITSSSVLPFGNSTLNIIIIAQMSEGYKLTAKDLVNILKTGTSEVV